MMIRRFSSHAHNASKSGRVFLVQGKRTPFGKFGESLKDVSPVDLAVHCSKALLAGINVQASKIDHVIVGNVVPSTTDTMYASRHVALKIGCTIETPAYNVNRLCGSGIQAIIDAAHMIKRGEAHSVLAAGTESMSLIPHLVYGSRFGTRFGPLVTVDMLMDALNDKYSNCPMAMTAENLAEKFAITRADADAFAFNSHQKAAQAYKSFLLQGEVAPFPLKKGELSVDEHLRQDGTLQDMTKLKSTFKAHGVVTPGTASGIVDGAASVLIASEEFVTKEGLQPLAEIGESAVVGVEPTLMGIGPAPAIRKLLERAGLSLQQIDLFEINEAFAAQALAVQKSLGLEPTKMNIWGGALALGHPLGASGVRISLTLARQMKSTNSKLGIASACIGGGQGIALLLKSV